MGGEFSDDVGTLRATGGMCGDDEQGRKFASRYEPMAAQVHHVLVQMAQALGKVGTAFPTMADNYENADDASLVRGR